jgi:hypothetical protein
MEVQNANSAYVYEGYVRADTLEEHGPGAQNVANRANCKMLRTVRTVNPDSVAQESGSWPMEKSSKANFETESLTGVAR